MLSQRFQRWLSIVPTLGIKSTSCLDGGRIHKRMQTYKLVLFIYGMFTASKEEKNDDL